jgi:hypothetical protein
MADDKLGCFRSELMAVTKADKDMSRARAIFLRSLQKAASTLTFVLRPAMKIERLGIADSIEKMMGAAVSTAPLMSASSNLAKQLRTLLLGQSRVQTNFSPVTAAPCRTKQNPAKLGAGRSSEPQAGGRSRTRRAGSCVLLARPVMVFPSVTGCAFFSFHLHGHALAARAEPVVAARLARRLRTPLWPPGPPPEWRRRSPGPGAR